MMMRVGRSSLAPIFILLLLCASSLARSADDSSTQQLPETALSPSRGAAAVAAPVAAARKGRDVVANANNENYHNILMIAIDDMRPEMTPYGYAHMHTPNLQRLADRSVLFERAYVSVALCMPSRTALLTSRRPDTTMNWEIDVTQWFRTCGGSCHAADCSAGCGMPNATTLPQFFKESGWFTVGMGKVFHEGHPTANQDYKHSWTPSTTNPATGIWEPPADPPPMYNGSKAHPSWYAYDLDDLEMAEGKIAQHAVEYLNNMTAGSIPEAVGRPFFLAVGFHKPHVPWYAPKKYWDFYPEDSITVAPDRFIPTNVPDVALQNVLREWATPKRADEPLSCQYIDLCAEVWQNMSHHTPYDNTTEVPDWKAKELRRAYWSALSFTDANIGRVLDALDASAFANNTIICLWGDHGYALGDNDEWAKQTNFEHATRIPLMISVPNFQPGRSAALVEEVDIFPTLVEAATLGASAVATCPTDLHSSRTTSTCTEGFSLMTLFNASIDALDLVPATAPAASQFSRQWAFSQYLRRDVRGTHGSTVMGYTMRTDTYRYTEWVHHNNVTGVSNFSHLIANELYLHTDEPVPVTWHADHTNVASDAGYQDLVENLHNILVACGSRPHACNGSHAVLLH